jgi:hypothetical protein
MNKMIAEGDPIPEGFVPGMVKRSKEQKEASNKKRKETCMKKYGGIAPLCSEEVMEKSKQTNIERYGAENPSLSKEVQERRRRTFQERYGADSPFSSEVCQEKAKQTNIEKYGVENVFASEEIKEKIRQTNLENLGVGYPMMSEEVRKKSVETLKKNYGVSVPLRSKEIQEKAMNSIMEKYGVPWNCLREEAQIYSNDSLPNRQFAELLNGEGVEFEREFRIGTLSFDFRVGNVLLEIDPTVTHNPIWYPFGNHKSRITEDYHQKKSLTAEEAGYRCIHIFDWDNPEKIINSVLKTPYDVYARKCVVKEVSEDEMVYFENLYHLQGYCKGQEVKIGIYYEGKLVSLMTFGKPRYNKNYQWELLRYCSSWNVTGGAERLFKHFIKTYNPESIVSYCDRSKFTGEVYNRLGFELKSSSKPSRHWYSEKENRHITDNLLRQQGYDRLFNESYGKGTSNEELILERGYLPVYDCGQDTFVWSKSK